MDSVPSLSASISIKKSQKPVNTVFAGFLFVTTHAKNLKNQAVLRNGVLIGKRKEPASVVFLFQFPLFYVEARFNPNNKGIEEFRVFNGTRPLQPYLDSIPIDDLLNN